METLPASTTLDGRRVGLNRHWRSPRKLLTRYFAAMSFATSRRSRAAEQIILATESNRTRRTLGGDPPSDISLISSFQRPKGLSRATPAPGLRVFWSRIPQPSAGSAYASRQNSSTSHLPELEFASTPWMIGGSSEGRQGAAPP